MTVRAWGAALLLGGAIAGVAAIQPWLARTAHATKEADEVYAFPPPTQLHLATLGWEAAAADLLWAKLLVEYGTHWAEHREFAAVPNYVDAILELDPQYPDLYKFVDTLLAYRPLQGTEADIRKAREYLERGTRERPDDAKLWTSYGQFLAFIAPSFLHDEADREAWRRDGAIAMGHGVELGADPDQALSAAGMLTRAGQGQMAIAFLERAYAFTEHPSMHEIHEALGRKLATLEANRIRDTADTVARAIEERRKRELPFLSHEEFLLLGPIVDPLLCAGSEAAHEPACTREWSELTPGASAPGTSAD